MSTTTPIPGAPNGAAYNQRMMPPVVAAKQKQARRPLLGALGVCLGLVGALIVVALVLRAGHRVSVIVTARPIAQGAVIQPGDLRTASISLDPALAGYTARHLPELIGKRTVTALPAGTLLNPDSVTTANVPAKGYALVALSLKTSQYPRLALKPGDPIRIVAVPGTSDGAAVDPSTDTSDTTLFDNLLPTIKATVIAMTSPDDSGTTDTQEITVSVKDADSVGLAARAATGRVSVILDSVEH